MPVREDVRCPFCGSLERHRLVWRFFEDHTDLFDGRPKRMLHVAPEASFEQRFRRLAGLDYTTADLLDPNVMVQMDLTDIPFSDGTFDVIYCSHVLEHVPDDRQAMRELRRVLAPAGWAVIQVPITAPETIEDPTITDPQERIRLFGQDDHVRRYGPDYSDRLREAGFAVDEIQVADLAPASAIERERLDADETVFRVTRAVS